MAFHDPPFLSGISSNSCCAWEINSCEASASIALLRTNTGGIEEAERWCLNWGRRRGRVWRRCRKVETPAPAGADMAPVV